MDAGESPLVFVRYGHARQYKYILEDKVPKRFDFTGIPGSWTR